MEYVFAQIEALALQASTSGRHKVLDFLRSLQQKLETPHDTLSRLSGMVSGPKSVGNIRPIDRSTNALTKHLEITAARIAQDLEIFQTLAETKSPMTAAQLAAEKEASPELLGK